MAFVATLTLADSYGRTSMKRIETTDALLAGAQTSIGNLATDLNALTNLELVRVTYSEVDDSAAFVGVAGSNLDVGGTFRVLLDDGQYGAHKIPGIVDSVLVAGSDAIDIADLLVTTYFAHFGAGGTLRMSDGQAVDSVVRGTLDR